MLLELWSVTVDPEGVVQVNNVVPEIAERASVGGVKLLV